MASQDSEQPRDPGEVDDDGWHIRVVAFARARELLGRGEVEVALPRGSTVADCLAVLRRDHPRLASMGDSLLIAVNEEYAAPGRPLSGGDTVALIPPVSGG